MPDDLIQQPVDRPMPLVQPIPTLPQQTKPPCQKRKGKNTTVSQVLPSRNLGSLQPLPLNPSAYHAQRASGWGCTFEDQLHVALDQNHACNLANLAVRMWLISQEMDFESSTAHMPSNMPFTHCKALAPLCHPVSSSHDGHTREVAHMSWHM